MRKIAICGLILLCQGCVLLAREKPFYERDYATSGEAAEWAKTASLADLCQGTKNWRIETVRSAARHEIAERGVNTRECYYTGMELTP